ncbi:MAG: hypothetical protein HYY93_13510 [Planctomycetes bacterium]|nr:hypothetical protein [Planctomycetota bacterium]
MSDLAKQIEHDWPEAQRLWASSILLHPPALDSSIEALAYTDLETREVFVNEAQVENLKLRGSVQGILAHEIGHHIKYPCTLALHARLQLLEKQLLHLRHYSLLNLFTDFLINEHVGKTHREPLIAVYTAMGAAESDPPFCFYLACYEELWGLEPGRLRGPLARWMEDKFPGYRGEAQMLASDLFNLAPNVFTQFIYFASVYSRYLGLEQEPKPFLVTRCHGEPSPDDYADAIVPSPAEEAAVERALKEGWIPEGKARDLTGQDSEQDRISTLPGVLGGDARALPKVMAAHYRRLAEPYLMVPPPEKRLGEPIVPTTLEEWEPGEPLRDIDWPATISQRGDRYGAALPLRREREDTEEGVAERPWRARIEIYLDVSGSMPDPKTVINAMTLAAQILALSALRHRGLVRALIYSGNAMKMWAWVRSELRISRFLMNYIGGGTDFPFKVLKESIEECGADQPIRAIISDTDFDSNYGKHQTSARAFAEAAKRSRPLVLLQHGGIDKNVRRYTEAGARVIVVRRLDDFPRLAAALARSLFGDRARREDGGGP